MKITPQITIVVALFASMAFAADYTGQVLSPDNKPVKGASVYLFNNSNDQLPPTTRRDAPTTQTDDTGAFHLSSSDSNVGWFLATADGYGFGAINIGSHPTNIHLPRPTDVTLTFLNGDKSPAAGVPIYVRLFFRQSPNGGLLEAYSFDEQYRPIWTQTTDDQGHCTFVGLPQGMTIMFGVADDRYAQLTYRVNVVLANTTKSQADPIQLAQAAVVSGKVIDSATGKPMAGIRVDAQSYQGGRGHVFTADDGSYSLKQLPAGTYNIQATLTDEQNKTLTAKATEGLVLAAGDQKTGIDFSLIPGVVLSGTVIAGDDGRPIPNVPVGIYGPAHPRSGAQVQSVRTDSNGAFTVRVPPGEQYVYVQSDTPADGYGRPSPDNQTVTIADGATGSVEFRLPRVLMSAIKGKVVDPAGNPVSGASVYVSSDRMQMFNGLAVTTNSDGIFQSIPMQRVGKIEIRAKANGLATSKPVLISQSTGEIVVQLEKNALASISGRVVDPQGNPLDGAPITLEIRTPRYSYGQDAGKSDAQGNFKIESLWPDLSYVVVASRDGYGQIVTNALHVQAGQDTHVADLTLFKRDTAIAGTLLDENDKPVAGKRIFIRGTKSGSSNINTDVNGKFSCAVVSNDPLTVFYNLDGRGPYRRQIAHAGDQNIVLHTAPPKPAAAAVAAPAHVEVAAPQAAASTDSQAAAPPAVVFDPSAAVTWNGWLYAAITLVICTFITAIASGIFAILKRKTA